MNAESVRVAFADLYHEIIYIGDRHIDPNKVRTMEQAYGKTRALLETFFEGDRKKTFVDQLEKIIESSRNGTLHQQKENLATTFIQHMVIAHLLLKVQEEKQTSTVHMEYGKQQIASLKAEVTTLEQGIERYKSEVIPLREENIILREHVHKGKYYKIGFYLVSWLFLSQAVYTIPVLLGVIPDLLITILIEVGIALFFLYAYFQKRIPEWVTTIIGIGLSIAAIIYSLKNNA